MRLVIKIQYKSIKVHLILRGFEGSAEASGSGGVPVRFLVDTGRFSVRLIVKLWSELGLRMWS